MPLPRFKRAAVAAVALCVSAPAFAGLFTVTPVRIFMTPRDRATAITVTNDGDEELVMQADVFTWKQKPGGEDELVLTEDLVVAPPILKLAPRSRQVVRLAMVKPAAGDRQVTYRLVVREIPEAKKTPKDIELPVALAFSLPVFITPPGMKRELSCSGQRRGADTISVACQNSGTAYAQLRETTLADAGGRRLAGRDSGLYLLPGIQRSFELRRGEGPIPAGRHKLTVALDDGSTQSFDVAVPE